MKPVRKDAARTRKRLLAAASVLFAEQGFRETTVAAICRRAGANVAAVNYHFGSKEELYVASWQHAFEASIAKHPPDGGVDPAAPARERFAGRVRSMIERIADPKSHEFEILHREFAGPTGLLSEVMQKRIQPLRAGLESVIGELLGPETHAETVRFCVTSVHAQCFGPLLKLRRRRVAPHAPHPAGLAELDLDRYAEHVVAFSLAGLRSLRRQSAGRRGPQKIVPESVTGAIDPLRHNGGRERGS